MITLAFLENPLATPFGLLHLLFVNPLKTLSFSACALFCTSQMASADFDASFQIWKEYRQNSTGVPVFRTGSANLRVIDGTFSTTSCALNPSDEPFGIDYTIACATGSNGLYIDTSDSALLYYELSGLEPATVMEPGYPDLVKISKRPLSDFPSKISEVETESASMFYNLLTSSITETRFGRYSWTREYSSRSQMEDEILGGQVYTFTVPKLKTLTETGAPKKTVALEFGVQRMVEGYVKSPIPGGFKFVNVNAFEDGFAEYDPRVISNFQWSGINQGTISSTDVTYVSFRELDATDPNAEGGAIQFPPNGERMRLTSPIDPEYSLPPGFTVFGEAVLFELTLERFSGIGDGGPSRRIFQLPVKFVNTFAGAMAVSFPANASDAIKAPEADPDGDGISNWVEWLSGTNPNKANTPKTLSALTRVNASSTRSGEPSVARWEMSFDIPKGLSQAQLDNIYPESSTDLKTWTRVGTAGDWKEVIDVANSKIYVRNSAESLGDKRYFRMKMNY